jgi:adenylosuccinate lyase
MEFRDPIMSESVMINLAKKGMPRQEAHRLIQRLIFESQEKRGSFAEMLAGNPTVAKYLSRDEIDAALDPKSYLGMSSELVDAAIEATAAERRARGLSA